MVKKDVAALFMEHSWMMKSGALLLLVLCHRCDSERTLGGLARAGYLVGGSVCADNFQREEGC